MWLAGLQNLKRLFLKRQSVQILASGHFKDVDVVLGNRTASSRSTQDSVFSVPSSPAGSRLVQAQA